MKKVNKRKIVVGILGYGEIGKALGRIAKEAGFKVVVRDLKYDEFTNEIIDFLYVSVPEVSNKTFVDLVVKNIKEVKPKLTIINSSITPGTTKKIYKKTKALIVHSPVIGLHPNLYESIRFHFKKIVGPTSKEAAIQARRHLQSLGLKVEMYDSSDESETAKLLDLIYFAWNIVYCKWVNAVCTSLKLNFDQVYTKQNQIYNEGYKTLLPNTLRPILIPMPGPISGHCTIPDTELFHKIFPTDLTKFILNENRKYGKEVKDVKKQREDYLKLRNKLIKDDLA